MTLYHKNALIIFSVFLMIAALFAGGSQLDRWASSFLKEPAGYFASAYEQRIFDHFRRKFPRATVKSVVPLGNDLQLDLLLPAPYQLLIVRDADYRVKSVRRRVGIAQSDAPNPADGSEWLGQLFYRIDAGDTAALLDFLFFQDIGIRYGASATRSTIARSLISDFPQTINPLDIHIRQAESRLEIRFTTARTAECLITLPLNRADPRPVDELQEQLLKKIEQAAQVKAGVGSHRSGFQEHRELLVPYLTDKVPQLLAIRYQRDESGKLRPQLQWTDSGDALLMMNNVLPVNYYGESSAGIGQWDGGKKLIEKLYQWCISAEKLSDLPSGNQPRLTIEYRGYDTRKLTVSSLPGLQAISNRLLQEGNFYYYPAKIENRAGNIAVNGMLYIVPPGGGSHHHFVEIAANVNRDGFLQKMHWVFYPYIRN